MIVHCAGRILDSASSSIPHRKSSREKARNRHKSQTQSSRKPIPAVKFSHILVVTLLGCSSCEKVRSLLGKGGEKPPAAAEAKAAVVAAKPYTGAAASEISASDIGGFRQQAGKVVIIDFYADWCGPCKQLGPILDQIASSHQGLVLVGKVNVDKSPELAASEKVSGIPNVRIFRDGKEVDRFVGLPPEAEVRRRVESQLKRLVPTATKPAEAGKPKVGEAGKPKCTAEKLADVETPKVAEPLTRPMPKDWMPEGMKRR